MRLPRQHDRRRHARQPGDEITEPIMGEGAAENDADHADHRLAHGLRHGDIGAEKARRHGRGHRAQHPGERQVEPSENRTADGADQQGEQHPPDHLAVELREDVGSQMPEHIERVAARRQLLRQSLSRTIHIEPLPHVGHERHAIRLAAR